VRSAAKARPRVTVTAGSALALLGVGAVLTSGLALPTCEDPKHGLSRDQIEQTMKDRGTALKACWKASGPHGELKLRVAVTTSPDGHVESAVADGKDPAAKACVEKQIRGWTFASAEAATKFSLPVNFTR
jgi:hypothetical protein